MFADSPDVNDFPYLGDTENYFPTKSVMESIEFSKISHDPQKKTFEILELMFSID